MPAVETSIWMALRQRILSLPGDYPLDFAAPAFERPSDETGLLPYIETANIDNQPERITLGSDDPDDRRGILTVTPMVPVHLKRTREYLKDQGGIVAAHFPKDLKLSFGGVTVRIEASARVVDPYRDDAYWRVPVSIRWQSFS
jgi:hypothetical protein